MSILPIRVQSGLEDVSDQDTPYQSGASNVTISPNTKLSGLVVTKLLVNTSLANCLFLQVIEIDDLYVPVKPNQISTFVEVTTYPAITASPLSYVLLCYLTNLTDSLSLVLATSVE
jgi:hypothetical protein